MNDERGMFGTHQTCVDSGVNPPYSPAYPPEWSCSSVKRLEVITRVDPHKIESLFAMGKPATPFSLANDRMAIRFTVAADHTMSYHNARIFNMTAAVAVRWGEYFVQTNLCTYCSDTIGLMWEREMCGLPAKDCRFDFKEAEDGSVSGWVNRRGDMLAEFSFRPDPAAPAVPLVDGPAQPKGELHVRRVPDFTKLNTVYSDVVYRETPLAFSQTVPGQGQMKLYGSPYDLLGQLEPEVLSARILTAGSFDSSNGAEIRKIVGKLIP